MGAMDIEQARFNMVEQQIRTWEVLDQKVLDLLFAVQREKFVPAAWRDMAFTDMEIPLGQGEAMLQPKLEARMVQASLAEQAQDGAPAVTALIADEDAASQPDAHRMIGELLAREWRIVHIAGHGMPPEYAQPQSAADA